MSKFLSKDEVIALQNLPNNNKNLIIQKSCKGNSEIINDGFDWEKKTENILNGEKKFTEVNLNDDLNFIDIA